MEVKPKLDITFRTADVSDAATICYQRNQVSIDYLHDPQWYNVSDTENWIRNMPKTSKRFMVKCEDLELDIGVVRIDHFDQLNRNCYVGADVFKDFQGKGYGKEIYEYILPYLFDVLNMNVVYLEVLSTNERAIHLYRKLGFQECGAFPKKIYRYGKYLDSLLFYLLKAQYDAMVAQ